MVDEFVLFDTAVHPARLAKPVQNQDARWSLVANDPGGLKGRCLETIQGTEVSEPSWKEQHWKTLQHHYVFHILQESRRNRLMYELRKWIADALMCEVDDLPPERTRLADIEGWDSLRHVGLIVGLEKS
jgi:hypothetical protein